VSRPRVLLHLPRHLAEAARLPRFYQVLAAGLRTRGAQVDVVRRDKDAVLAGSDVHFVHNGAALGPGVLNCAIAYLNPYFYVDPKGIYFESSLAGAEFDGVAAPEAQATFDALVAQYVTPRTSRYKQPVAVERFPDGAIAVFLQDWSEPVERARHMDAQAMVETVIRGAAGRPVIVKPHPRNRGVETVLLLNRLARRHPEVIVTEANLHDILAAAAVCVSISSSVALEAMLHRKPVVLFGRSDLHHCAETVTKAEDWPAALNRALSVDWPFAAFVDWFARQNLRTGPAMIGPVLERMRRAGGDMAALGVAEV